MNPEKDPRATDLQPLIECGMGDMLPELIAIFLETAPRTIEAARKALDDSHAGELAKAAHLLSGSCGNFGAERLLDFCRRLETFARSESLDAAPELIESVEKEFVRVRAELLLHIAQHG